jgi:hypothetical protein
MVTEETLHLEDGDGKDFRNVSNTVHFTQSHHPETGTKGINN